MQLRAREIATAVTGGLHGDDVTISGVAIDSRQVVGGELFVPIVAERDGHDFIPAAVERGAALVLTQRRVPDGVASVAVADTAAALLDVGRLARRRLGTVVVGITGSVGKTSTKDLTAAALARAYRTAAAQGSFNNELGVPLTLANAPDGTEATVVELGARGRGHIALLCDVAHPTIGVVTAVQHAHTEMFGSIEEVAVAKGELVEALPSAGTAVLNGDDLRVAPMASRTAARVLRYSLDPSSDADVVADGLTLDDELRPRFTLRTPWGAAEVALAVRGEHQAANALAAAGAALAGGVPLHAVADGLGDAVLSPWRMDLQRSASGAIVLNDSYNANPASMAAALRSLAAIPARRRIAVLGVMAELGERSDAEHAAIAALADDLGVDLVAYETGAYGLPTVDGLDGALATIGVLDDGDAVLVKGSRVAGLERLADALLES